jgi:glutathione S-transferase
MKLVYFNGKGMAETTRILLAAAGVDYEDFRYPLKINDWATYDFTRDEFDKDKADGKLWKSMGKVPFLEVKNSSFVGCISQSKAIERYVANEFGFMGNNNEEAALIDSYCEILRDFKSAYHTEKRKPNKKEAMDNWFNVILVEKLKNFEKIISNDEMFEDEFSIGDKLSLADVSIYSFLVEFFDNKEGATSAYKDCPKLKAIVKNVINNEKICHWLNNRPVGSY